MSVVSSSKERIRFIRFISVGAVGAVVDFGIMNLFSKLFNMPLILAGTISFICAIISNFVFNRFWTYPDSRSRSITKQLTMFFIVNVAGLAIRLPILHYFEPPMLKLSDHLFTFIPLTSVVIGKNLTLAIAVSVVMLWNFFINRYWTYNDIDKVTL
jgi:putative flippase GtrA